VKIQPAGTLPPVPEGQNLAAGTIGIPTMGTRQARADWIRFLVETERNYADEMRRYLREDLQVKANIIDSQMAYGELASFAREAGSDYADEHAYWQHPVFPTAKWDSANWTMTQASMVPSLAKGDGKTLARLATHRVAGKPYSISEYCVPAPNDFQAEMFPILASYAALQDWDAIYHFDYGDYGEDKPSDRIQSFFSLGGNPLKESFAAAAALLFRQGAITPLQRTTTLRLSKTAPLGASRVDLAWAAANGGQAPDVLSSRLQVAPDQPDERNDLVQTSAVAETSSAKVLPLAAGAGYVAQGPGALAVAGFVGGDKVTTPNASFQFPAFGNNYAAFILSGADGKPLSKSERLLLTIGGQVENIGMGWNADRTSVSNNWGTGPAQVEGIPATVTLTNTQVQHVWALDATGVRIAEVPLKRVGEQISFAIGPQYKTLCYEIGR
jgi:hypothetical protein